MNPSFFYFKVADYMLPRPRKREKVSVIVNDDEWLHIITVECGLF